MAVCKLKVIKEYFLAPVLIIKQSIDDLCSSSLFLELVEKDSSPVISSDVFCQGNREYGEKISYVEIPINVAFSAVEGVSP